MNRFYLKTAILIFVLVTMILGGWVLNIINPYCIGCVAPLPLTKILEEKFTGCYESNMKHWSDADIANGAGALITPPRYFELTCDGINEHFHTALILGNSGNPEHDMNNWFVSNASELSINWSTGFSGIGLQVNTINHPYVGKAEAFCDYKCPDITVDIKITKINCDTIEDKAL